MGSTRSLDGFEALAVLAGDGFQGGGRDFAQGAAEKLLIQGGQPAGEIGDVRSVGCGMRNAEFAHSRLAFVRGADLTVPLYGSGFGNGQALADGGKAVALDAEAKEVGTGGW